MLHGVWRFQMPRRMVMQNARIAISLWKCSLAPFVEPSVVKTACLFVYGVLSRGKSRIASVLHVGLHTDNAAVDTRMDDDVKLVLLTTM